MNLSISVHLLPPGLSTWSRYKHLLQSNLYLEKSMMDKWKQLLPLSMLKILSISLDITRKIN